MKKKSPHLELKTTDGKNYIAPSEGSLGLLALGHVGLMTWREKKLADQHQKNTNKNQQQ